MALGAALKQYHMSATEEFSELSRAEDILLGSMGYGEGAKLANVTIAGDQITLHGEFSDGEAFSADIDQELSDLEHWALNILEASRRVERKG